MTAFSGSRRMHLRKRTTRAPLPTCSPLATGHTVRDSVPKPRVLCGILPQGEGRAPTTLRQGPSQMLSHGQTEGPAQHTHVRGQSLQTIPRASTGQGPALSCRCRGHCPLSGRMYACTHSFVSDIWSWCQGQLSIQMWLVSQSPPCPTFVSSTRAPGQCWLGRQGAWEEHVHAWYQLQAWPPHLQKLSTARPVLCRSWDPGKPGETAPERSYQSLCSLWPTRTMAAMVLTSGRTSGAFVALIKKQLGSSANI